MLVAGGGVADAAGRESLDMLLALLALVHVHGSVQDDEDLGALVYVPDVGWSVQCRRTVASSISVMSRAPQGRSAVKVLASRKRM